AEDTALARRSPRPRLYSRLPRSSALPSRVMRADGRSLRYLAWQAMAAWNSGRSASWSKSKYTTRWRRQASVSRSSGVYAPGVGAVSVVAGGVVSAGGGVSLTFFEHATAAVHSRAAISTRVVVFMVSSSGWCCFRELLQWTAVAGETKLTNR